jgi:hypothetical protein
MTHKDKHHRSLLERGAGGKISELQSWWAAWAQEVERWLVVYRGYRFTHLDVV